MACYTLGKTVTIADATGTIGDVAEITPPEIAIDELETTVHDATYWRTFCAGLKNGGTLGFKCFYDKDSTLNGFTRLFARAIGDPSLNTATYTMTFPGGKTMIFTGMISGVPIETPIDDNITFTFNVKVSGAITCTLGT